MLIFISSWAQVAEGKAEVSGVGRRGEPGHGRAMSGPWAAPQRAPGSSLLRCSQQLWQCKNGRAATYAFSPVSFPQSTLWPRKVTSPQPPLPWLCPLVPFSPRCGLFLTVNQTTLALLGDLDWLFPINSAKVPFFCSTPGLNTLPAKAESPGSLGPVSRGRVRGPRSIQVRSAQERTGRRTQSCSALRRKHCTEHETQSPEFQTSSISY